MSHQPRVTVWNEYQHEKNDPEVAKIYPNGIHEAIAQHLRSSGMSVQTATLEQPEHGLTDAVLADTDVLIWWGHIAHNQVQNKVVDNVLQRVLEGMGLIALHSSHFSKSLNGRLYRQRTEANSCPTPRQSFGTGCDLHRFKRLRTQRIYCNGWNGS